MHLAVGFVPKGDGILCANHNSCRRYKLSMRMRVLHPTILTVVRSVFDGVAVAEVEMVAVEIYAAANYW